MEGNSDELPDAPEGTQCVVFVATDDVGQEQLVAMIPTSEMNSASTSTVSQFAMIPASSLGQITASPGTLVGHLIQATAVGDEMSLIPVSGATDDDVMSGGEGYDDDETVIADHSTRGVALDDDTADQSELMDSDASRSIKHEDALELEMRQNSGLDSDVVSHIPIGVSGRADEVNLASHEDSDSLGALSKQTDAMVSNIHDVLMEVSFDNADDPGQFSVNRQSSNHHHHHTRNDFSIIPSRLSGDFHTSTDMSDVKPSGSIHMQIMGQDGMDVIDIGQGVTQGPHSQDFVDDQHLGAGEIVVSSDIGSVVHSMEGGIVEDETEDSSEHLDLVSTNAVDNTQDLVDDLYKTGIVARVGSSGSSLTQSTLAGRGRKRGRLLTDSSLMKSSLLGAPRSTLPPDVYVHDNKVDRASQCELGALTLEELFKKKRKKCDVCGRRFSRRNTLEKHRLCHEGHQLQTKSQIKRDPGQNGDRPFACTDCGKRFTQSVSLQQHIRTHTGERPYVCDRCGTRFRQQSSLLSHVRAHDNIRPFKCEVCEQTFVTKSDMKRHLRRHTGEKPHSCPICGERFSEKSILIVHMRRHTGERPFICGTCSRGFTQRSALQRHERVHSGDRPYNCEFCKKSFADSSVLRRHMFTHGVENGVYPFVCTTCSRGFTQKTGLRRHERTHTGERPYDCQYCHKDFTDASGLKRHLFTHGVENGVYPFVCGTCSRGFAQKTGLQRHERTHTGERPYECQYCHKDFLDGSGLKRHLFTHGVGGRPHVCSTCSRGFTQQSALKRHERIHTGEKPYSCQYCSRTFADSSVLRRHLFTHGIKKEKVSTLVDSGQSSESGDDVTPPPSSLNQAHYSGTPPPPPPPSLNQAHYSSPSPHSPLSQVHYLPQVMPVDIHHTGSSSSATTLNINQC